MRKNVFNMFLGIVVAIFSLSSFADVSLQSGLWVMNLKGTFKSSFKKSIPVHLHSKHDVCIHNSKILNDYFIPANGFFHCLGTHDLKKMYNRVYINTHCNFHNYGVQINEKGWVDARQGNITSYVKSTMFMTYNGHPLKIFIKDKVSGRWLSNHCKNTKS